MIVDPNRPTESSTVPSVAPDPSTLEKPATDGIETSPTPAPESDADTRFVPTRNRDAILNLDLPSEAKVWINGRKTTTLGSLRSYVSRNLEGGRDYEFEVKAVVDKAGRNIAMHRKVTLQAGSSQSIKFDFEQPQLTQLSLQVPEDAIVTLSGNPTSAKGEVRYFKSRTLKPGESWSDYRITVTVVRDGKTFVAEKTLDVESGEEYELGFDFNQPDLYVSK